MPLQLSCTKHGVKLGFRLPVIFFEKINTHDVDVKYCAKIKIAKITSVTKVIGKRFLFTLEENFLEDKSDTTNRTKMQRMIDFMYTD